MKIRHCLNFGITLLIIAVMLIAVGCGKTAAPTTPAPQTTETPKPANPNLILATTTSTQDSGLLDALIPVFEQKTGYKVKTVAVGTGAALAMGEKGDADVLLVHAPASEKKLVDNQSAINYQLVMHNDFVIVGPSADPAKVKETKTVVDAFKKIADSSSIFVSRGDDSGTDKMEKALWTKANVKPSEDKYQATGQGMGQTLTVTSEKEGYTLTDRATFLATQKNLKLEIVLQGDASLLNIYHVMQVNPEKFPKVNADGAKAFVDFMTSPDTQTLIGTFGKDKYGQALFFPDAGKKMEDLGK
ncbi:ABC-type tungstate transport system, permease component [Desulfosporosinus orientis DSM 765]|uniref:ABC-type tungstate transport system, permease component n=1 Tax=Desulfosporosinus orientis (strain ATCC 19365 / DSM 765 / NCIMB 8382 / VKM B-1628 / Singapore I) TaxID=768706 RepID=G7WER5_DESOD|nr:substrate-binding domain-containing protein [Desulfosporosinus orientis]AET66956.1 ABC-type tungstate transport system, permease component [Desulfosporosinus orientis DSM 765]